MNATQEDVDVLKATRNELEERYRQQCLKTEAAHNQRREAEEQLAELQGKLQWLHHNHEALNNEHKSLLELCYKLIKAARVSFRALDELKRIDEQDWRQGYTPLHRSYKLLEVVLEDVNRRWP